MHDFPIPSNANNKTKNIGDWLCDYNTFDTKKIISKHNDRNVEYPCLATETNRDGFTNPDD